jgi:4-hydroxymandelate oxidase
MMESLSLREVEDEARRRLDPAVYDFFAGGAGDEVTVRANEAAFAIGCGVDALAVSNHGGRQLDTIPATIEVLPQVADAVGGTVPLLLDGGVRRGTDVLKALALGADAVAIGRPVLWGLAVDGEDGVARVLDMLHAELDLALALCGCRSPRDVSPDLVWRRTC